MSGTINEEAIQKRVFEKVKNRCFACVNFLQVYKSVRGKLTLKQNFDNVSDLIESCKYGFEEQRGPDAYEQRHQIHDTRSPHSSVETLEDDTTLIGFDHDEFIVTRKTPKCSGFEFRFDPNKKAAKHTQLSLGGDIPFITNCTEEEKENIIKKVMLAAWSVMHKDSIESPWRKLTWDDRILVTKRLRTKYSIRGYLDVLLNRIHMNPLSVKPRTPAVDICWPYLNKETKDFFRKWLRVGDEKIMKDAADLLVGASNPDCTEEYINTGSYQGMIKVGDEWVQKPIIETRNAVRRSDILLTEEDLDKMEDSIDLWFKLKTYKLHKGDEVCAFCGHELGNIQILSQSLLELTDNEFYWINSKIPIARLCLIHLNEMRMEYRELIRRGVYSPLDINYSYDTRKEESLVDDPFDSHELNFYQE